VFYKTVSTFRNVITDGATPSRVFPHSCLLELLNHSEPPPCLPFATCCEAKVAEEARYEDVGKMEVELHEFLTQTSDKVSALPHTPTALLLKKDAGWAGPNLPMPGIKPCSSPVRTQAHTHTHHRAIPGRKYINVVSRHSPRHS
jgi:hypothetical protein